MSFSVPIWSSIKKSYSITIINDIKFIYNEKRSISKGQNLFSEPNILANDFIKVMDIIANQIHVESKSWFASQIKPVLFMKKVTNIFMKIPENNYGNSILLTWFPHLLVIYPNHFELFWNVTVVKAFDTEIDAKIEYSNELDELKSNTVIIQSNPAELCEIESIEPTKVSNSNELELISRANLKKKIRETRLKATILAMKAERMAEKYFRRYGLNSNFEYESDLSLDSDGDESEEQ